jgi:hypothetical protein
MTLIGLVWFVGSAQAFTDSELTATAIIAGATIDEIIRSGTTNPDSPATLEAYSTTLTEQGEIMQTMVPTLIEQRKTQAVLVMTDTEFTNRWNATQTGVAATHDPSRLTPSTPAPIQETYTAYNAAVTATESAYVADPLLRLTPSLTPNSETCLPRKSYSALPRDLLDEIFRSEGIVAVNSISFSEGLETVNESGICEGRTLAVSLYIDITVTDLTEEGIHHDLNIIIEVLQNFFTLPEEVNNQFRVSWTSAHDESYVIQWDYEIAIAAYNEGLRGDDLIEAMGGPVRLPSG